MSRWPSEKLEITLRISEDWITHAPADHGTMDSGTRDALFKAIERVRGRLDFILTGKTTSFNDIAAHCGLRW